MRLLVIGVLSTAVGVVVSLIFDSSHNRHQPNSSHHQSVLSVVLAILFILVIAGLFLFFIRKAWRAKKWFAAPLALGLPRSERRAVVRAVRLGVPSQDSATRAVEVNLAQRIGAQNRWSKILFPVAAIAVFAAALLTHDDGLIRWYYVASGVLMIAAFAMTLRTGAGAKEYLSAVEKCGDPP